VGSFLLDVREVACDYARIDEHGRDRTGGPLVNCMGRMIPFV
jgi:hypothetical protein